MHSSIMTRAKQGCCFYLLLSPLIIYPFAKILTFKVFYLHLAVSFCVSLLFVWRYQLMSFAGLLRLSMPVLALFLVFFISISWSGAAFEAQIYIKYFLFLAYFILFLALCCASFLYMRQVEYLIFLVVSIIVTLFVANLLFLYMFGDVRPVNRHIANILGAYSNQMAFFTELSLVFLFYLINKNPQKQLLWLVVAMAIFNLLIGQSRAAIFILLLILLVSPLLGSKFDGLKLAKIYAKILIIFAAVFLLCKTAPVTKDLIDNSGGRLTTLIEQSAAVLENDESFVNKKGRQSKRSLMIEFAWETAKSRPVLGLGFMQFKSEMAKANNNKASAVPHNVFLEAFAHAGLLGLGTLCLLIYAVLKEGVRGYRNNKGVNNELALWYLVSLFAFLVVLLNGQVRPILASPLLYFTIANILMARHVFNNKQPGSHPGKSAVVGCH